MRDRYLHQAIQKFSFHHHKMAFISGPRQCGKTTLAKLFLKKRKSGFYYNWDEVEFRRQWTKDPKKILPEKPAKSYLLVLDEIHKARAWKRQLKGFFDVLDFPIDILVTGSARLNIYKKGGDSLLGRYFHFRLHPFSLREIDTSSPIDFENFLEKIFTRSQRKKKSNEAYFEQLMDFGGFPEPLFSQNLKQAKLWRRHRLEQVIREDLRDLSRIPELSQVEMLASLLPERVGAPLSLNRLREILEVTHQTVKRWIKLLEELYYCFSISPYHKKITRGLKKEKKYYLWDWREVEESSARFENLVASHLLKTCHFLTDTGEGHFELQYIRNKQKEEVDFIILKDKKAFLLIEAKENETVLSSHFTKFMQFTDCQHGIQIVKKTKQWQLKTEKVGQILIASAADLLPYFA